MTPESNRPILVKQKCNITTIWNTSRAVLGIQAAQADWLLDSTPDLGWSLVISLSGLPVLTCVLCQNGIIDSGVITHESIYELNCESSLTSYDSSHDSSHDSHWGESWLESSNHLTRPFTTQRPFMLASNLDWHLSAQFKIAVADRPGIEPMILRFESRRADRYTTELILGI